MSDIEKHKIAFKNPRKVEAIKKVLKQYDFVDQEELAERLIWGQWCASRATDFRKYEAFIDSIKVELDRTKISSLQHTDFHILSGKLYEAMVHTGVVV